jgi:mono/diheme cytochrome c family protein
MENDRKQSILEKYKLALQRGERFWPDSIYKDLVVSLGIFIILVLLAIFIGVPVEPKADPSDTAYVPKPEWYFLFLFKFLALYGQIPVLGKIEWIATVVIPGLAVGLLFILPLIDRNPRRAYSRRVLALSVMGIFLVSVVTLTMLANIPTTTQPLLQFLGGLAIPGLAFVILFGLSLLEKRSIRSTAHARIWVAGAASVLMIGLTLAVMILAPPAEATESLVAGTLPEQIAQGQDLYSINCVECHGAEGEGGEIKGVEGLEGFKMKAINSQDEMYTRNDQALADIISYGQPNLGMQPFGKAYGGVLSPTEIDSLVAFMRYTWDDRAEMPAGALTSIPALAANEVPSWDVHIQPLTKRYCVSCHRAGKTNNNYLETTYEEMLTSGDNAPVITAGDPESLLLQLINGHEGTDPKTGKTIRQMPPTRLLNQQFIDMLTRWILNGMPRTAGEAAALSPTPAPTPAP